MTVKPAEADRPSLKLLLMGGLMLLATGLILDERRLLPQRQEVARPKDCVGEIHEEVALSREQLAQFLTISERDSKAKVAEILKQPYCPLSDLEIRAGVAAERVIYPLVFDPKTWLVVLYEGDEYAGYQFRFRN
ncbi:MAG TPA: hypothetical protein V6D10_20280 [Trichocoleus sp.]|jgi:hypothetical protein